MGLGFYLLLSFNIGIILGAILGAGLERSKFATAVTLASQQVKSAVAIADEIDDKEPNQ